MKGLQRNKKEYELETFLPIILSCLHIFKYKPVYIYYVVHFFAFIIFGMGIVAYGFLIDSHRRFWMKYGLVSITCTSLVIQLGVCLTSYQKWEKQKKMYATQLSWDLDDLPLKVKNKILLLCKNAEVAFIVGSCLVVLSTVAGQIEVAPSIWSFGSNFDILEKYFPRLHQLLLCNCWMNVLFMVFMVQLAMYYGFVPIVLTKIQFIMLLSMIKTFGRISKKCCDNCIREHLKILIKRHQDILRVYSRARNESFMTTVFISFSLLFGIICNTLMLESPFYGLVFPIINYLTLLIATAYFSYQGQLFEDLNDNLHTSLYELNWYDWKIDNLKLFKLLYLYSLVPVHHHSTRLIQINHGYLKQIVKVAYTLGNLAQSISH